MHRGIWLLGFAEVPDRTGAESLRGTRLFVDPDDVAEVEDDDEGWYEDDLVGLAVVLADGTVVGEVAGLETRAGAGPARRPAHRRGEALVPFVEEVVPEVDPQAGRVVIDPPAGLLELNAD